MSSRIKAPGQTDQRKVYLNWANHHLRKLGGEGGTPLADLKEIGDGQALPRLLKAVVQEAVPGIHATLSTDEHRRENVTRCIEFLDKFGVNCASFSTKDLCDGKDRAVLSLFYNLSQYKRTPSNSSSSKSTPQAGGSGKNTPQPSRIARPVSPGLRISHGVNGHSSGPVPVPSSPGPVPSSPVLLKENSLSASSTHSTSPPATSPLSPNPAQKQLGPRRTAGSSILTSTTFDRLYTQRKTSQKITSSGEEGEGQEGEGPDTNKALQNDEGDKKGAKQNGVSVPASNEAKSDTESSVGTQPPKQARASKLTKHGSFSFGHAGSKETRLIKPGGSTTAEEAESATPPSKVKGVGGGLSKLQALSSKHKEPPPPSLSSSSSASSGDAPEVATASDNPSGSKLKILGSGQSTPSSSARSGLQRPSSRLSKMASGSGGEGEGSGEVDKLPRLQRKGSDGVAKRHLVAQPKSLLVAGHTLQSGSSASLPRHMPKGTLMQHGDNTGPSSGSEQEAAMKPPAKSEGFGLKRPTTGGLKKPGTSLLSGVCTPNLPSSGPQSSTTSEAKDRVVSVGGVASKDHTPSAESSPSLGRKLVAPKAAAAGPRRQSVDSRVKRPMSPSSRLKLHKVTPASSVGPPASSVGPPASSVGPPASSVVPPTSSVGPPASSVGAPAENNVGRATTLPLALKEAEPKARPLPLEARPLPLEAELCSSLESCEVQRIVSKATPPPEPTGQSATEDVETKPQSAPGEQITAESAKPDAVVPPAGIKEGVAKDAPLQNGPLQYGRRISPEGMAHEETSPQETSPQDKETSPESTTSTEKEGHTHQSRYPDAELANTKARARSLSPGSSYRLVPKGMSRVKDLEGGIGRPLVRVNSSESTNSEGTPSLSRKPLKSSLRQKRSGSRHSSSSSVEGVVSPSPRQPKVTISPRSSQVVYDPGETGLNPAPNQPYFSHKFLVPGGGVASDRPSSFTSMDSSTTSDSLSPSSSSTTVFPRGGGLNRHASLRSTMSEQLDYRNEQQFLNAGMNNASSEIVGSTPELIESFENQLTNMKAELTDKEHMLSMYENSMADLSTKMHVLKKSLEEKDNAIRHLTDKQTWYDLEGHSLMSSRAASMAGDREVLSDGYLSDSAMEEGKDKNKKKKPWKFSFRHKKKDGGGMDHLSPNMDTESIMSGRSAKSLKRSFVKKKAPDLVSISEYPTRYKDIDTKSTITMDMRSEYGGGQGMLPVWEDDIIKVYDDPETGARAEVVLFIDTNETVKSPANDSGYYGDLLGRLGSGNKWNRDSVASSDSGNHGDETTEQFMMGTLSISPELSWVGMDTKVTEIFHHHINTIDPETSLGVNEDSIYCYMVGEERRQIGNALLPPITPHHALANKLTIKVLMKGAGQQACDSLAYKTLMGVESLQSYMGILQETQWLVVMGTKGTCKSSLVGGLAQHLSSCLEAEEGEGMEDLVMGVAGGEIIRFNLDKEGLSTALKYFKTDLSKRVQLQLHPPIIVLEDIYECKDLEQLLVVASGFSRRPYIVAALSAGTTQGVPLHQLMFHHQIRVITCNPHTDPVVGILARSLRKQIYQLKATAQSLDPVAEQLVNWVPYLLNHLNSFISKFHSNVVNLGPRVFMACPLGHSGNELESWFLSLWNHFIIPYLMGTIMAGIETYTADPLLEWVDVREWVIDTYPWPSAINVTKLRTLHPEDVGWNHAVRPHQNRYIMYKEDKLADDARSMLRQETQSMIH